MDQDFQYEIGSLDGLARAPPPATGVEVIRQRLTVFDRHKRRK